MSDNPETLIQHAFEEESPLGSASPPLFQSSLFTFTDVDELMHATVDMIGNQPFYTRSQNPTTELAEKKIAALEGADRCRLFGSGMGAITAGILGSVKAGDHIVCVDSVYMPARHFLEDWLPRFNVTATFIEGTDPQEWAEAAQENTTLFMLESPSSIIMRLQDLSAVAAIAKERSITTMVDSSYCAGITQQAHRLGIDLIAHSVSKYLSGHSDVVAGALCGSEGRMDRIVRGEGINLGAVIAPFNSWLILRGMRTLPIRMKQHAAAGDAMAAMLANHPAVEEVWHVGTSDQAELRDRQMSGWGGLLSFTLKDQSDDAARRFSHSLEMIRLGVSWGGYESLCVPLKRHHIGWDREKLIIRLYCGLEAVEDQLSDVRRALEASA